MKRTWLIAIIVLMIALAAWHLSRETGPTITIASWNLQVFGDKKASDADLLRLYADKIDDYDIVFLQEIRDADGSSFEKLCRMLPNYTCINSSRAGRSSSKEQYGVVYRSPAVLLGTEDYNPKHNAEFERPPLRADFSAYGKNFSVYVAHLRPDSVKAELSALEKIVSTDVTSFVVGDLNADCGYYDEKSDTAFRKWTWVISDQEDTTVGKRSCTYDRILSNDQSMVKSHHIDKAGISQAVSDHYIVSATIGP